MLKVDPQVPLSEGLVQALESIQLANIHVPLVKVKPKGSRLCFIIYAIHDDDPIYAKVKNEDDEGMSDACRAVYFSIKKDVSIDMNRLIRALKEKVRGVMRKQRRIDAMNA